jgi:thermolabile hemolysin
MKKLSMIPVFVFICVSFLMSSSAFCATFTKIVVFGDSMSDNGNMYALSSGTSPSSANAFQGRYSDGPVWVEYMAQYLGAGLVDLAQGGAETGESTTAPTGLKTQVLDFTQLIGIYPAMVSKDTLYVVWAGPNDFFGGSQDYATPAQNIGSALDTLATAGAKYIVVPNMPNLGATPMNNKIPQLATAAQMLTQAFNASLDTVVETFKQTNPSITVYEFDIYTLFQDVQATPSAYGFTNVTGRYVNNDDTVNDDGNVYLFWDSVHPTTKAHKIIAQTMAAQVGADSPAWYSGASGTLTIPQLLLLDGYSSYNVVLDYVEQISGDPDGIYFKLNSITGND